MTDTTTLAPTDAEIDAAYRKVWSTIPHAQRLSAFAHEIASTLAARWGAPAPAPTDDLQKRCAEIIGWHRTGVLVGDTLRSHAESKWPGDIHNLQMAERATENEALCFIAKWGAPAPASDQWRRLFGDVAELVKCLPSSFPDANGHVFKKLRALVEQAPSDGADMPEHWSVVVNIGGKDDPLLTIGHNWLSGAREPTEADTQAIIGAAQHLLAFVGYGLPPTSFDPDEAAPPAQEARVPLTSQECRDMLEEVDHYNFAIDLIRAVEKHHGIAAAQQKEAP